MMMHENMVRDVPLLAGPEDVPMGATHALVCLHGFGADGRDFIGLAEPLQALLAPQGVELAVFCPHGLAPCPMGQGYQWFRDMGWTFKDPAGMPVAKDALARYLVEVVQGKYGIPPENVVVMGFSQGAMTTLYAVPRLPFAVAGQISVAGMMVDAVRPEAFAVVPTLFVHGVEDDILPADKSVEAEGLYKAWGVPTQLALIPHLGHGVDALALAHIAAFLGERLGDESSRAG